MSEWVYDDAGRRNSKRPKQRYDCVVRAVALCSGLSYDDSYETMKALGRKCGRSMPKKLWKPWLTERAEKHSFPAILGQERMKVKRFCEIYNEGRWVVQVRGHVFAVLDGVPHDMRPVRSDTCVYAAWRLH